MNNQSHSNPLTKKIELSPFSNKRINTLCGPLNENIRHIERSLDVKITHHQSNFVISCHTEKPLHDAAKLLEILYAQADQEIDFSHIQERLLTLSPLQVYDPIKASSHGTEHRKKMPQGKTKHQISYLQNMSTHDITFCIGPAGTGKTYLAVACAVEALHQEHVKRIILTRPAVEAGERLGFLPGDLQQKVDPYLRPLFDALYDLLGFERVQKAIERHTIEIAPLAYMRGRTLNHAFIILDEAQNTTPEQMKMFLTRLGIGSKAVITGDNTQIDLTKHQKSGLQEVKSILCGVPGIAFSEFNATDVVRHPLVQRIVNAYEQKQPS